jgi:Protein of unknown function (DUF1223)
MIAELARTRPDLLLLTFHVTYWNYLGWHDPYSFDAATQRQRRYVALGVSPEVYTPAFVVDGKLDAVGSDPAEVDHALRQAALSEETAAGRRPARGGGADRHGRRRYRQRDSVAYRLRSPARDPCRSRREQRTHTRGSKYRPLDVGSHRVVRQAGSSAGALPARTGCRSPPAAR